MSEEEIIGPCPLCACPQEDDYYRRIKAEWAELKTSQENFDKLRQLVGCDTCGEPLGEGGGICALDNVTRRAKAAERTVRAVNYAYELLANRGDDTTATQLLVKVLEERDALSTQVEELEGNVRAANAEAEINVRYATGMEDAATLADKRLNDALAENERLLRRREHYGCHPNPDPSWNESLDHALAQAAAANGRAPKCAHCGKPATCLGRYEGHGPYAWACNDCCGHGNEDGQCWPIVELSEVITKLMRAEQVESKPWSLGKAMVEEDARLQAEEDAK